MMRAEWSYATPRASPISRRAGVRGTQSPPGGGLTRWRRAKRGLRVFLRNHIGHQFLQKADPLFVGDGSGNLSLPAQEELFLQMDGHPFRSMEKHGFILGYAKGFEDHNVRAESVHDFCGQVEGERLQRGGIGFARSAEPADSFSPGLPEGLKRARRDDEGPLFQETFDFSEGCAGKSFIITVDEIGRNREIQKPEDFHTQVLHPVCGAGQFVDLVEEDDRPLFRLILKQEIKDRVPCSLSAF